ncbi:MAG: SUMF1/EgtB/PvdO family nonheme iron enzyme [Planctomycetota bacterium]|nr:SUMF1/EgtB/PvdO family nonheme iron enzyme [Planctomycetota bacterium]
MPIAQDTTMVTCPRCGTRVSPDFRFCPACAYRIQAGLPESPAPAAPTSLWPHVLLVLGALALIGGFVLAGIALFESGEPEPTTIVDPSPPPTPQGELTMQDLADNLVWHADGFAEWHDYRIPDSADPLPLPVIVNAIRVSRYEITRGQWREFLNALREAPPERLYDHVWKRFFRPIEAFEEDLCDQRTLFVDDLERPGGFIGDAVLAATDQALRHARNATFYVGKAQEYVDYWWFAVAEHTEAREDRRLERPARIEGLPVDDETAIWLLTPPSWVRVDDDGAFSTEFDESEVNLPVTEVTLPDAISFAAWASHRLGITFYVPTRAEFMRAYHDGAYPSDEDGNRWPWGFELNVYLSNSASLWAELESPPQLFDVRRELGNVHLRSGNTQRGLVHMSGNVREWVQPQVYVLLSGLEEGDPLSLGVMARFDWRGAAAMGGSYLLGIEDCDFASSLTESPLARKIDIGFRVVTSGVRLDR